MNRRFFLLLVAGTAIFSSATVADGQTYISGNQSGTLYLTNSPYIVTLDISVPAGQTLTIEPGVVLQFTNIYVGAFIYGTLIAHGTAGSPILFTSDKPVKQPGQWKGLDFASTAGTNSVMENCIVECAGAGGFSENIRFDNAPPVLITNCTVRSSATHGMTLYLSDPRVFGCTFSDNGTTNGGFAIAMRADCLPVFRNNTASGNGKNAIGIFGYYVSRSGSWVRDNLPYTIYEEAQVSSGVTLTIEPGTVIQFERVFDGLYVDGTLIARGTALNPIVFTSDDAIKQPGQWRALAFRSTAGTNCVMENCVVECAGTGGYSENIRFDNAPSVLLSNCTVRSSAGHGLTMYASDPRVFGCGFTNNGATNGGSAIAMRTDCLPVLRNNTAQGNGRNAIGVFGYYVNRTGTWVHDNLPYTIYEEAQINNGVTLTIEPGTVIQFERIYDGLYVDGTLIARGTTLNPILFTSDDAVKEPGQWRGMAFRPTASTNTIMENCIVECAASPAGGNTANIRFDSAPPLLLTNCTIRSSAGNGLTMYASDPRVFGCGFTNNGATNGGSAIAMRTDCLPVLRNNTAQGNGRNAIGVFGYYVNRTGTWVRDNLPYTIYEEAQVNNGVSLTIEPGTVIQFERFFDGLYVDGTLLARGTPLNPIVFTSDDAGKQPGQWRGIAVRATATNTILENCTIEYGGSVAGGFIAGLRFDAAPTVLVTHCIIRGSPNEGIYCNLSSPLIGHCRIETNARDGVRTVNGSSPVLTNCAISANAGFGVNNLDTTRIILAQGNYWGHPSGPYDNANTDGLGLLNPGGLGDQVSEYVNWGQPLVSDPTGGESPVYLTIARAGNQVILSWPDSASGYSLQAVTNLSTGTNPWLAVTNPVVDFGGRYNVNDNLSGNRKYYRLGR